MRSGTVVIGALGCREDPVSAALSFRYLSNGSYHTCGVTSDNRAYCWGLNESGQLGDGTRIERWTPVAVAGPM